MSKQDRQGVRTPADVERKYNLGAIRDASQYATQAQKSAEKAQNAVGDYDKTLDQAEILRRLTDDWKSDALYLDENGVLFLNANYLKSGVISSKNGGIVINLDTGAFSIPQLEAQTYYTAMVTDSLINGYVTKLMIASWYTMGLWTSDMVNEAVEKGIITSADASAIVGVM